MEPLSMFGTIPSNEIQENVRTVLRAKRYIQLPQVYEELLPIYGIDDIKNHPQWPAVFRLICDAPTIQRRVRDFQNGSLTL